MSVLAMESKLLHPCKIQSKDCLEFAGIVTNSTFEMGQGGWRVGVLVSCLTQITFGCLNSRLPLLCSLQTAGPRGRVAIATEQL